MNLPLAPPLEPQLARTVRELPGGEGWVFEPKWDGFRALLFADGEEAFLQSRNGRDLGRYFPELVVPAGRYVLDGELVIVGDDGREDFAALQARIHPARSRIELLARSTPATMRAFDALADSERSLLAEPFAERRSRLSELLELLGSDAGSLELTPVTADRSAARRWLQEGEGVIAKRLDAPYRPGERRGMARLKRVRTADCVVAGYRPGRKPGTVGSLILGVYDEEGELRVVGHASGLRAAERRRLRGVLAEYETGRSGSAEPSRWSAGRELEWVELRPELVVEVSFDHVSAGRIRHGASLLRWRDDKEPRECRIEQLQR